MSFTFSQARAAVNSASLAFTSPVTSGNLIVVAWGCESANPALLTVADTVGTVYTLQDSNTGGTNKLAVWAGIAAGSGANTVTFSGTFGSSSGIVISEYSGPTLPKNSSGSSYNNATPASVTFTTTVNTPLIVAVAHAFHGDNTFTAGPGYTMAAQANGSDAIGMQYGDGGASGSKTPQINVLSNGADDCPMVAVAFPTPLILTLVPGNPATATLDFPYSQPIAGVINGTAPYSFAITAGSLPPGLTLASSGTLSGTATSTGDFSVTVQVTDAVLATASGPYTVHVAVGPDIGPHDLTSENSHPPFVVSQSGGVGGADYRLFSSDPLGNFAFNLGGWVQLDVGSGWRENVIAYTVRADTGSFLNNAPRDWTIQGSDDGLSFTAIATVTGEVSWFDYETRLFFVTGAAPPRFLRMVVTATADGVAGHTWINKLAYFRPGPADEATPVSLAVVNWVSFDWTDYNGVANIWLGSALHTPGGVFPGDAWQIYLDGTSLPVTTLTYPINLMGDLTIPAVTVSGTDIDVSGSILWFMILGAIPGIGLDNLRAYGLYFRAYYSDGSHRYSFPSTALVELFGIPGVDNPELAVDDSLDTSARVFREFFSTLSTPAVLRVSGFGPLVGITADCNNPPVGVVGTPYAHTFTVSAVLDPVMWTLLSGPLPSGLALSSDGVLSGTPVLAGVFAITMGITGQTFSLEIPHEETETLTLSCSITISGTNPSGCPEGTGSQVGPG